MVGQWSWWLPDPASFHLAGLVRTPDRGPCAGSAEVHLVLRASRRMWVGSRTGHRGWWRRCRSVLCIKWPCARSGCGDVSSIVQLSWRKAGHGVGLQRATAAPRFGIRTAPGSAAAAAANTARGLRRPTCLVGGRGRLGPCGGPVGIS